MLEYLIKEDLPEGVVDIVDVIGMDAFKSLVKFAGGSNLYVPNESSLVKGVRNRMIRDSFDGDYRKISRKFGLSTAQVRNIVNYK
jgi:Mor family transcriptional regulator